MQTRRSVLAGAASALATSALARAAQKAAAPPAPVPIQIVRPRVLKPGDTVALVAPSSYVFNLWSLETVTAKIEALGLKPRLSRNSRARHGYMAGTAKERVADLHEAFSDPAVAAVFCIEGGYGTERLLDSLDYGLIRRNPKILLGYSDITGLHLAIGKKSGLVTFHGPVATSSLPSWTFENLRRAIFSSEPLGELGSPPEPEPLTPVFPRHTVAAGTARGPIAGGNLTLISTTMGTPFEIDARGRILFLEDTGEAPYRIDRMLTQLKLAGKFAECAGVVWGTCTECTTARSNFEINLSISDLVDEILGDIGKPVLAGLAFGHTKEKLTVPMGAMCELDATGKKVTVVEAGAV